MAATELGLYELLAPQFPGGILFAEKVDRYLSKLDVDELRSASDESGVVYTGRVSFRDEVGAETIREHQEKGAVFRWEDVAIDFRLTIPRDGTQLIDDAASAIALGAPADPKADDLDLLFTALGPVEQAAGTATEFPGIRFRLELLLTSIALHLPKKTWIPGKKGPDFRIIPDPDRAGQDVRFLLPKMVFEYEQGDDFETAPTFRLKSWGSSGFDAPADLEEGEVVTMEPPIALRTDGRYAFSVEHVVVDLSPDHTPPEILEFFGTDEAFEGFFIKGARFFYGDKDKDFAFDFAIRDLLFSFAGEISFEAQLDLLFERAITLGINVTPKFFDHKGEIKDYIRGLPFGGNSNVLTRGAAKVPQTAFLQMEINGGIPDYNISVKLDGVEIFDATRREARISPGMPGTLHPVTPPGQPANLVISVSDSAKTPNTFSETIRVIIVEAPREQPADRRDGAPADRPPDQGDLPGAVFTPNSVEFAALKDGFSVSHVPSSSGIAETLVIRSPLPPVVRVNGVEVSVDAGRATFDVKEGTDTSPLAIEVAFPQIPASTPVGFPLRFKKLRPDDAEDIRRYVGPNLTPKPFDQAFADSGGRQGLLDFLERNKFASVQLDAFASFQEELQKQRDLALSARRLEVAQKIIAGFSGAASLTVTSNPPHGFDQRPSLTNPDAEDFNNEDDQVVIVQGTFPPTPAQTVHATISRKKRPIPDPPPPGDVIVPADREAPRPQTRRPPVWKRLSFRTRFERNEPVLGEVSGTIDFETESEEAVRRGMRSAGQTVEDTDKLGLKQTPAASKDPVPQDGVVDFKLNVAYDTATGQLTETLSFGNTEDKVNGLLRMDNLRGEGQPPTSGNRLHDIFGAVLVFAPIINSAAAAIDSKGDWAVLAVSLGVPVAIGALDIFQTKSITLFAGTGVFRQFLPPGEDAIEFTDFGVVFDYRVEFGINFDINLINLHVHTTKPLKVRYNAVGFNVHLKDGEPFYQPIFDTSKGYEVDLSDPGLLDLPAPLGSVLKIAAARIARFNPLTLELDLALKADLGVITVDRFKVKAPLDPPGVPSILPSGVKVNIPATLIGSGYVNILEGGFEGAIDLTLVPSKIRVAADIAVQSIEDAATQRKAVAVFAGLVVEFPTPIVLGASGLGIYGFAGLFAMHYRRNESARSPGDSVAPALRWLERAGGEPQLLVRGADRLWVPEFDRWSFGIGAVLGTLEGAFLINLRGMFVLELPGPRLLIFVKVELLKRKPALGDPKQTVGILGIIDINPPQITIGVIIEKKIEKLIAIRLPVEILYTMGSSRKWHLHIGTIAQPAEALVLNAIRAHGYFMLDGDKIESFPAANGPITLPGIAVATGIKVSLLLGSEKARLYLRCAAEAHLGVAFSPFFITGNIFLKGELRLFIVSIEATGKLGVKAPDPTIIDGEVCGKVSFFFFSVKGCVRMKIGSGSHALPAPPLVRNLYLQSHAPVISAGQGGDRPIDATLGDAVALDPPSGGEMPVVPIDSVPVLQMHAAPRVNDGTNTTSTFTEPLAFPPNLTPNGFINVGGGRQVRYFLKEIALDPPLPAGTAKPPATWRTDQAPQPQGVDTNVDLALFSRVPVTAARALERSTELSGQITDRWSGICDPVAPPVCVLWTFCRQPLGPSAEGEGWRLTGIPEPDPPGTTRHGPPPLELYVEEPARDPDDAIFDQLLADAGFAFLIPARVLGINPNALTESAPPPVKKCIDFRRAVVGTARNPRVVQGVRFFSFNVAGKKTPTTRTLKSGARVGLHCANSLEFTLPEAAAKVEIYLVHDAVPAVVVAMNEDGTRAARQTMTAAKNKPQLLTLEGAAIRKVIIRAQQTVALLLRVCFEPRTPALEQSFDCFRALQLPQSQPRKIPNPPKLPGELQELAKKRANNQWIILHTGIAVGVKIFVALAKGLASQTLVQELDVDGSVLTEKRVSELSPTAVTGISRGLPTDWVAPAGPWDDEVIPAATFVADARFSQHERWFFEIRKPHPKSVKIRLMLERESNNLPVPAAVLVAVEVCSKAEQDRAEEGQQIQTGQVQSLSGFLNGGAVVPLLEPNRIYTITARYDIESKAADGTTSTEAGLQQRFRFKTDAHEPPRLDPWVLGTRPDHEDRFHFYEEPVKLVFNDLAIVQLFAAYGKNLRAALRAADGVPVAPDELTTLDPIVGEFSSAYRDFLAALIAAGFLPCVGEVSSPFHGSFTSAVTLRPLMGYTFDVELVPPNTAATSLPLYRRSFATSRFANLTALINDVRAGNIRHRALTAQLPALPAIATDQQIQDALLAAGEQALPAPATTDLTIYWAVRPGTARFFPHVILIDAAEPLWRTRSEPRLETVPNQNDPAFQRVVPQQVTALEIIEQAGTNIAGFIRSPGGTRTLALVANTFTLPAAGATITLAARTIASALYGIAGEIVEIAAIKFTKAPWEEDDV